MARGKFSFRVFTSLILAWTFLALVISGAVLYVAPAGRIANWTRWQLAILTKEQWQAVHVLAAITFLTGGLFHLLKFNWKAFVAYLRKRSPAGFRFRHELGFSLALVFLVLAGTIAQVAPFSAVMATAESLRNAWEDPATAPPVPHFEESKLSELAGSLQMEPGQLIDRLRVQGINAAGPEELLKDVAARSGRSPMEIYEGVRKPGNGVESTAKTPSAEAARGQGLKTLTQLSKELGMTPEEAVAAFGANGILSGAAETLHDIAVRNGMKPYELMEILQK